MKLLSSFCVILMILKSDASLQEYLKRMIEANAIAPTFSGIAYERCSRTVSQSQLQLAIQLVRLFDDDFSLKKYIADGQACHDSKGNT